MPRIVTTTVSSVARKNASMCSRVGIFLKSSASASLPRDESPDAVIWRWKYRSTPSTVVLPFTNRAEASKAFDAAGGSCESEPTGTRMVRFDRRWTMRFCPIRPAARPRSESLNVLRARRVLSIVPRAITTTPCLPSPCGRASMISRIAPSRSKTRQVDPVVPWSPTFHQLSRRSLDLGTAVGLTASRPAASACSSRQSRSVSRDGTTFRTRLTRLGLRFARRLAWGMERP